MVARADDGRYQIITVEILLNEDEPAPHERNSASLSLSPLYWKPR
jgi:hypothetical protein